MFAANERNVHFRIVAVPANVRPLDGERCPLEMKR
jgi:hypothetical protein